MITINQTVQSDVSSAFGAIVAIDCSLSAHNTDGLLYDLALHCTTPQTQSILLQTRQLPIQFPRVAIAFLVSQNPLQFLSPLACQNPKSVTYFLTSHQE